MATRRRHWTYKLNIIFSKTTPKEIHKKLDSERRLFKQGECFQWTRTVIQWVVDGGCFSCVESESVSNCGWLVSFLFNWLFCITLSICKQINHPTTTIDAANIMTRILCRGGNGGWTSSTLIGEAI